MYLIHHRDLLFFKETGALGIFLFIAIRLNVQIHFC